MNFRILFIILCYFYSSTTIAQLTNLKFENFGTNEGLSSSTCVELFQDREGVLWIGTNDGLNKYDGYNFEVYRPIPGDINSISNNRINTIIEDFNNNLWIGTDDGLNVLDKGNNRFFRISLSQDELHKVIVYDLFFDELTSILWIATNNGVSKILLKDSFELNSLNIERYQNNSNDNNSISQNNITSIQNDLDNQLWFVSNDHYLNKYNTKSNNFTRYLITQHSAKDFDHLPKATMVDSDGDFWIGNNLSHLVYWNTKKNKFEIISIVDKDITIFDIYQDRKGLVWIATDGDGIYILDKKTREINHILNSTSNPFSLPNNQPSKIFEDQKGIFWIASYNKGISKLVLSKSDFGHYFHQSNKKDGLSDKIGQAVLEDSSKRIWIGTGNGGLNLFNEKENSFTHYKSSVKNSNTISSDKILSLSESYDGSVWIGTWDGGLNNFNPETKRFTRYLHSTEDPYSIGQNTVWTSVEDSKKRLWFGTSTTGLNMLEPNSKKNYSYKKQLGVKNTISSNFVFFLSIDSKNRLLVGTSMGLSYVDLNTLKEVIPTNIQFHKIDSESVQNVKINYVSEDHAGNYWVGTNLGILKLDTNFKLLKKYTTKNGLPNNIVVGIVEDDNFKIWITTKGGVCLIDPILETFSNYNTNDGLQGLEFQSKSIEKTKDGRLLMGGLNGFNLFKPINVFSPPIFTKPIFTNLKLFNKTVQAGDTIGNRVLLDKSIKEIKNFVLNYNEGFMTFEFVALNYKNPKQTEYEYRLIGLEENYINSGNSRSVNYANLLPGKYTFEVMSSIKGQWGSSQSSKINFTILPPPWKTWWSFCLYFIFVCLIVWVALKYYTQKVQEEQSHKLNQMKLQFFINVSHEFRTPLTLILNPVEKLLSSFNDAETVKSSAVSIQRSARRLLHLVNQLLDNRKMEVGMSPLQFEKGEVINFSKDIFLLFEDLANKKLIDYRFNSNSKRITSLFDFDKVEKIITNLISNAIKFTNDGGEIVVSINKIKEKSKRKLFSFRKESSKEFVEIIVKDSGIGLSDEQLKNVFSRFYNVVSTKTGTGIGLNFTKGLVELHGGNIQVESEYNKGTKFTVLLPIKRDTKLKKEVKHLKNEFLINSVKATEYAVLTTDYSVENGQEVDEKEKSLPTLLIVEDNKELRLNLKNDLKGIYKVKEAVNGEEGLKMVKKKFPDIVISDVMMPKMDGFEMCKKIKTELETCHIPVILLTARALEEDRIAGYDNGADGYLSKPFKTSVLVSRVKNLLDAKNRLRKKFSKLGLMLPSDEIVTNSLDQAFLDKITNVVIENISDMDFKLDNVTESIGLGSSQFYRKLQTITGQNPSSFIRTIRLKFASELLIKNEYSIKEISFMSGFNSTSYFGKTFKDLFEMTPKEFIEKNSK
jgi:ligand-binding sensor domain-containing protein/DNA-binding response OmpR family regulator/nitrogen-specific signal transduction histidine kinase